MVSIILFFVFNTCFAQNNEQDIIVINFSNNFFFELITYPMVVEGLDSTKKYIVEGDENSIVALDVNNNYFVTFHGALRRSLITIYEISDNVKTEVFNKLIYFYPLPLTPLIRWTTCSSWISSGQSIEKSRLKNAYLSVGIINYNVEKYYEVVSYSLIYVNNKGQTININVDGPIINEEVYSHIQKLKSGDPVIFDNIFFKGLESFNEQSFPIVIYLK
jgi:hypothetical protein